MDNKQLLTKQFKMIKMNEAGISCQKQPIIGTQALATCIGVLLYSEENKKAIVAHVSMKWKETLFQALELIVENKLDNHPLKYKIIPGYYEDHYEVKIDLENFFISHPTTFIPFDEKEIDNNAIQFDNTADGSYQFAFDSSTGTFVTDKVLFGNDYLNVHNQEIEKQL